MWCPLAKRVQRRKSVVASLPFLFPYIGSSGTNLISYSTMLCTSAAEEHKMSGFTDGKLCQWGHHYSKCMAYGSMLSPSGTSDRRVQIQWHSFAFRKFASSLWITKIERCSRERPSELNWLATGFSRHWCLISDRWLFISMWSTFSVSPT